jgi:mannose-6-phosphate isomerase-like protein (cupin superfamily)
MDIVDYRDIEKETLDNKHYRQVIHTIKGKFQLVLMCLKPNETIPEEIHDEIVQFIRVESGTGICKV